MIIESECDFCGKQEKIVCTTHGCYCLDCFKIIRDECQEAINELEEDEDDCL